MTVNIIGAGLAGSECALFLANNNINVNLYEMKKIKKSPAHKKDTFAEIVCSNSFKSNLLTNACGLLKEELRQLGSSLIPIADKTSVPSGQALSVDRDNFSNEVTKLIKSHKNINVIDKKINSIDELEGIIVIATRPLTDDELYSNIKEILGDKGLSFYDAASPIIEKDSIDFNIAFYGNRYEQEKKKDETIEQWKKRKQESSYINLPLNENEYIAFYNELINAQVVTLKDFEKGDIFEGCMPIEIMAKRGVNTLRFGPLKPVGFDDPRTGKRPYAVVQLRQDNLIGSLYNMVGFQTNLKYGEQKRVFSMIPGLENATFTKYGVMHRNSYINGPKFLDKSYKLKKEVLRKDIQEKLTKKEIYFAGQISGVEGYVESIASGLMVGLTIANNFKGNKINFSNSTIIGALSNYVSNIDNSKNFSPMNANFGIIEPLPVKIKDKKEKYMQYAKRSLEEIAKVTKI